MLKMKKHKLLYIYIEAKNPQIFLLHCCSISLTSKTTRMPPSGRRLVVAWLSLCIFAFYLYTVTECKDLLNTETIAWSYPHSLSPVTKMRTATYSEIHLFCEENAKGRYLFFSPPSDRYHVLPFSFPFSFPLISRSHPGQMCCFWRSSIEMQIKKCLAGWSFNKHSHKALPYCPLKSAHRAGLDGWQKALQSRQQGPQEQLSQMRQDVLGHEHCSGQMHGHGQAL